jgi:hypothetical protein
MNIGGKEVSTNDLYFAAYKNRQSGQHACQLFWVINTLSILMT